MKQYKLSLRVRNKPQGQTTDRQADSQTLHTHTGLTCGSVFSWSVMYFRIQSYTHLIQYIFLPSLWSCESLIPPLFATVVCVVIWMVFLVVLIFSFLFKDVSIMTFWLFFYSACSYDRLHHFFHLVFSTITFDQLYFSFLTLSCCFIAAQIDLQPVFVCASNPLFLPPCLGLTINHLAYFSLTL